MAKKIIGLKELQGMAEAAKSGELPGDIETLKLLLETALFQTQEVERLKEGIKDASALVSENGRSAEWSEIGIPAFLNTLDTLCEPEGFGLRKAVVVR